MDLNKILELKNQANNLTKEKKWNEAEISYKNIISKIEEIPNEKITDEILNQKKLILSNLSLVLTKQKKIKEAKKLDIEIIRQLDKKFAKSYARLINTYLDENKIACARYHYNLMKDNCSKEDINKFPDVMKRIEKEIEEKDSVVKSMQAMKELFKNFQHSSK
jgi:uncharacterized membrane-anchored protein